MFQILSGVCVFDNGASRIWRCNNCGVWTALDYHECCVCQRRRPDFPSDQQPAVDLPKAA